MYIKNPIHFFILRKASNIKPLMKLRSTFYFTIFIFIISKCPQKTEPKLFEN